VVQTLDTRKKDAAPNVVLDCSDASFLQRLLAPPADPIPALTRIEAGNRELLRRLRVQALRLVAPELVDVDRLALKRELTDAEMDRRWRETLAQLGPKRLRWRPEENAYRPEGRQP
jgi:hypothetical protein